jgi:hypothetical protein
MHGPASKRSQHVQGLYGKDRFVLLRVRTETGPTGENVKLPTIRISGRAVDVTIMCLMVTLLGGACGTQSGSSSSTPAARPAPSSNRIAAKRPGQILAAAQAALASSTSVHMRGTIRTSGQLFTFDVILTKSGAKGSVTGPLAGVRRASVDFVAAGRRMYLRSSTLWRKVGGATLAALLDNRWVRVPSRSMRGFPWVSTAAFARVLTTGSSDKARSVGRATVVDGQPVVPVKTRDEIVYVATTGTPFPVRVVPASRRVGSGGADFLDYDAPVSIAVPAGALDFSHLHG